MLSQEDATVLIHRAFPGNDIKKPISYRGLYIFPVFGDDPVEGDMDPFFSVNQATGELKEFSILTDGDINEISDLFVASQS